MKRFSLLDGETVITEKPIHWKNYISSVTFFCVFLAGLVIRSAHPERCLADSLIKEAIDSEASLVFGKIELLFYATATLFFFGRIAKISCIRYYVTNKRILVTSGFFTIRIGEMLISRCETVMLKQSIYERLFRCADLMCLAPGSNLYLEDVPDAERIRSTILNLIAQKPN